MPALLHSLCHFYALWIMVSFTFQCEHLHLVVGRLPGRTPNASGSLYPRDTSFPGLPEPPSPAQCKRHQGGTWISHSCSVLFFSALLPRHLLHCHFHINTCLNLLVALNPRDPQSSKLLVPLGEPKKAGWEQLLQTSALLTVHLALGFSPTAPH